MAVERFAHLHGFLTQTPEAALKSLNISDRDLFARETLAVTHQLARRFSDGDLHCLGGLRDDKVIGQVVNDLLVGREGGEKGQEDNVCRLQSS